MLNMRFEGTDTALMVLPDEALGERKGEDTDEDFERAFRRVYKAEFGFLLDTKSVVVDDIKVRGIGKTFDSLGPSVFAELKELKTRAVSRDKASSTHSVYFDRVGRVDDTPVFELPRLEVGDEVEGPAMIIDDTQTIVIVPGARSVLASKHLVITLEEKN